MSRNRTVSFDILAIISGQVVDGLGFDASRYSNWTVRKCKKQLARNNPGCAFRVVSTKLKFA